MAQRIVSRQAEEQALADFFDSATRQPCALVIEGDAGIGKTTLWQDTLARARDRGFRVLTSRAAAAESVLAYTALADLVSDVDDPILADLPAPQQAALDAALLRRRDGTRDTDARAVAAAFVTVIDRLAAEVPVLVAIDDLQWLDTSSANVVSFAARRLPVGAAMVWTVRTGEAAPRLQLASPDAVRRIRLQPLTVGELHQVLTLRLGGSPTRPALLRLHSVSGGNPFYALELAREIGTRRANTELGLPASLSDLVRTRIGRVGTGAKDVLLAMSCVPAPTVQLVAQVTGTAPDRVVKLLDAAEAQAVVAFEGNRVQFTHPLLAHGVYSTAAPGRRRAMHRRLAELVTEPELRARHLALSDPTGEPQTLEALDTAAEIARGRGAPATASELLELAMRLGGDTPERRIRCAAFHFNAGNAAQARALLERTIEKPASPPVRAQALNLLAVMSQVEVSLLDSANYFERALGEAGDDLALRVQILVALAWVQVRIGRLAASARSIADAVTGAERLGHSQQLSQALGMRAVVRLLLGDGLDERNLRHALALAERETAISVTLHPTFHSAMVMAWTGQLDVAHGQYVAIRQRCIERGEESDLVFVSFHCVLNEIWRADFGYAALIAEDTCERARQLEGALQLSAALAARGIVSAYIGREPDARRDVSEAIGPISRSGSRLLTASTVATLGFLEVSLGNYPAAIAELEPLLGIIKAAPEATEIFVAGFLPDAVEALIGVGRADEAEPLIAALERNGRRLDRAWMLAVALRGRAMQFAARGDLEGASATAELAMAEHERLPMPFERARTQLLLGQLQRRQRHRDTATATLREAQQTFDRLGTPLWATRAGAELARGTSGRRRTGTLTPSEQRVAELAVSGMTNREIAAALFISPKTVEVNLSRSYQKLGVRSRVELYRAIDTTNPALPKE
ncbi:helix-turn-helix transcriptional regulator [Mycobacterium palustre]|uniref:LuxR family transcriptional regulator n=1 Tax=Mycobacterium palustre TaxID=153971 RepID=A0A1X1ZX43_9MYCO|nr:LuxR family transcriptional regulator [Mycobacterium palustre]MCV7100818.1 AAA family ATPase [Mycobacterium palustre]ORW28913.1 LuxR family transcriptional regulator [Mycobacterium palustre]